MQCVSSSLQPNGSSLPSTRGKSPDLQKRMQRLLQASATSAVQQEMISNALIISPLHEVRARWWLLCRKWSTEATREGSTRFLGLFLCQTRQFWLPKSSYETARATSTCESLPTTTTALGSASCCPWARLCGTR